MIARSSAALALAVLLSGSAWGAVDVGSAAPPLAGKTWFSKDGKAPGLTGKVHVIEFWFAT